MADDLARQLQRVQLELAQAQARIAGLSADNTRLRQMLSAATSTGHAL